MKTDPQIHIFQHRYIPSYTMPEGGMKAGKYKARSDWYKVDLPPQVGDKCSDYILYAVQPDCLFKTTYDTFEVVA